jgi:transcriptional regulator with XRE-family HTH domain
MTQAAFAEDVLFVSLKYVQRLEAGSENVTIETLVNLANQLGVTAAWLFEEPKDRTVRRGRPPSS